MQLVRKVCIVTGNRSDFGILQKLITLVHEDEFLELQLLVTGAHLCSEHGNTISEIIDTGIPITDKIEMQISGNTAISTLKSLGVGIISFSDCLNSLKPDVVIVLGDRYEIFSAAICASTLQIPVCHISGGEVTAGAIDDWIRHTITKISWLHFPATKEYAQRIRQLGEDQSRIFVVGDPTMDQLDLIKQEFKGNILNELNIPNNNQNIFIVTLHAETNSTVSPSSLVCNLLSALEFFENYFFVFTAPNPDHGGLIISTEIKKWINKNPKKGLFFESLGQKRYMRLINISAGVVGNSSSGIVEAPALKVPTLNIGSRQSGRIKSSSIVDVCISTEEIKAGLLKIISEEFLINKKSWTSAYGQSGASQKIYEVIKNYNFPKSLFKDFFDIPDRKKI